MLTKDVVNNNNNNNNNNVDFISVLLTGNELILVKENYQGTYFYARIYL